jgi:23S rRNA (uracil1939-C5)-methyltransferase
VQVTIEKLVYGGEALAHHEGSTVFVPFVLPGEVVEVQPVERRRKFVRARPLQILTPAAERMAPACPHFIACGGCHYQHISAETQLHLKTEILRETLARLGRIQWPGEIRVHASPPFGYRNRAQWKIRPAAGQERAATLGYHRAGSATVLAVDQCPILAPPLASALHGLRALAAAGGLHPALRGVEAFCDPAGQSLLLNAVLHDFSGDGQPIADALRAAVPGAHSLLLHYAPADRFEVDGPGFLRYPVADYTYRVGHLSFFQVNSLLLEALVHEVTRDARGDFALDLFAGVGLFTLPLARAFTRTAAVESNEAAVRDLQSNADHAGMRVEALAQDVARYLTGCKETPDLVVLDPPRAGIGAPVVAQLLRLRPRQIIYVSCDPATLARDLAALTGTEQTPGPYALRHLQLFDMFPQTFHIEAVVHLALR